MKLYILGFEIYVMKEKAKRLSTSDKKGLNHILFTLLLAIIAVSMLLISIFITLPACISVGLGENRSVCILGQILFVISLIIGVIDVGYGRLHLWFRD